MDGRYSTGMKEGTSPLSLYTGGEIFLSLVRIRGGYQVVGPDSASAVTLGLGSESPAGALEYAISVPVSGSDPIIHYIGLRIRTSPKDRGLTK